MSILTDEMICAWLRERQANAERIGRMKSGPDRAGWMEDAAMFREAARAIEYYKSAHIRVLLEQRETGERS